MAVSKLLKEGTKTAHRAAENVHYVKEFVKGRVNREIYGRMIAGLYFVYQVQCLVCKVICSWTTEDHCCIRAGNGGCD